MKRFSVIYTLKQHYYQVYCDAMPEAKVVLQEISGKQDYVPIGIYDAKTELFAWEPRRQDKYDHAGIEEQGKLGNQIIGIAQALRYRDTERQRAGRPHRLNLFA